MVACPRNHLNLRDERPALRFIQLPYGNLILEGGAGGRGRTGTPLGTGF